MTAASRIVVAPPANVLAGIMFMCLAVSVFPFLNAASKYLTTEFAILHIVWARFAGHTLYSMLLFMPGRGWGLFRSRRPGLQLIRAACTGASNGMFVTGLIFLPLATAAAIGFTSPLIVTALSMPLLGERVGPRRWAAVIIGFIGALIIIRPTSDVTHWSSFLILGSASLYAVYQLLTRMVVPYDSAETSIAYTPLIGLTGATIALPFVWVTPGDWVSWVLFAALGLLGGLGHYFVVKAFQYAPAAVVSPFSYGQLLGATALGYVTFGNFPDLWTWVGAAIIVGCGLYITYREAALKRAAARA